VAPPGRPRPELNDGAPEIGPPTAALLGRAGELGLRPARRSAPPREPRYVVLGDDATRLLVDCDQPCRPDLPYHAHADSLAIHLVVDGVPVIVDRGVATYEPGRGRAWWRSTAAHSTLVPAGGDTSEVRGAFRAGRLARTRIDAEGPHAVVAAHDGAGRPERAHLRRARQDGPRGWTLWDVATVPEAAVVRFHLPPGAAVEAGGAGARIDVDGCRVSLAWDGARDVRVVETEHALGLGRVAAAPTIDVAPDGPVLRTRIRAAG
jgi:hypothetical protein